MTSNDIRSQDHGPEMRDTQPHLPKLGLSKLQEAAAEFDRLRQRASSLSKALCDLEERDIILGATIPETIRDPSDPARPMLRSQLERLDAVASIGKRTPTTSRVDAFDGWLLTRDESRMALGIPAMEEAWSKIFAASFEAAAQVVAQQPATIQEAAIKYRVMLAAHGSRDPDMISEPAPFFEFLDDLKRMT